MRGIHLSRLMQKRGVLIPGGLFNMLSVTENLGERNIFVRPFRGVDRKARTHKKGLHFKTECSPLGIACGRVVRFYALSSL